MASMTEKLLKNLRSGKEYTAQQIQSKFGFANPYRAVGYLREKRIAVYGNLKKLKTGERVKVYRVGNPSASMLKLGFTS